MHIPRFTAPPPPLPLGSVPAPAIPTVVPTCLPPGPQQLSLLPPVCHPSVKPPALNEPSVDAQYYSNFQNVSNPTIHPYGVMESYSNVEHHHRHGLPVETPPQQEQSFCYTPVKMQHCSFKTVQVSQFQRSEQPDVPSSCFSKHVQYSIHSAGQYHPAQPNTSSSSVGTYQGNVACNSFMPRYPVGAVSENIGSMLPAPDPLKYSYITDTRQIHSNNERCTGGSNVLEVYYHTTPDCVRSQQISIESNNKMEKEQQNNDQISSSCLKKCRKRSVSRGRSQSSRRRSTSSRRSRCRSRSHSRRNTSGSRRRSRSRQRRRNRSKCRSVSRSRSGSRRSRSGSKRGRSGNRRSRSRRSSRAARSGSGNREDGSKHVKIGVSRKRSRDRNQHNESQSRGSQIRSNSPDRPKWAGGSNSSKEKAYSRERKVSSDNTSVSNKAGSVPKSGNTASSHSSTIGRTNNKSNRSSPRRSTTRMKEVDTEREILLKKWRQSYCATSQEMQEKLEALAKMTPEEILEAEKKVWTRAAPADLFYVTCEGNHTEKVATPLLAKLCDEFEEKLVKRAEKVWSTQEKFESTVKKTKKKFARHTGEDHSSDSSSNSTDEDELTMEELKRKSQHPYRLHPELWFNDPGEMNDGPLCRCSAKAQRCGIRHGIYSGENSMKRCDPSSNNANRLHHYRITISPPTNFLTKTPTIVKHDGHEFIFEGFSMLSHYPLAKLPTCKVIRFNIEYTILYVEEKLPDNFTVRQLDLFYDFLFKEVLELVDLDFKAHGDEDGCPQFHFMPRFVRDLQDNGKEILSMNVVMQYLMNNSGPLFEESSLDTYMKMPQFEWQNFADEIKGMVVTYPGMKPCSLRVDQLDRDQHVNTSQHYPEIVHFGVRPPQLSYAGNPEYQKAWREYVKFRHLLANMPKPSFEDKRKLESKEMKLQEMRTQSRMKRDVTVAVSAKGFHRTGIMCDVVQHAMLIPVLVCHLRFHRSCDTLETVIDYKFQNRYLLQLALTHPSYRENFGTNPDHARNTLTNCGIRQPEYGDRRIHYMNTRKRGINTLINIMSRFGKTKETGSNIIHNERLEFLGDAVVEFLTSIHLFHMLPNVEEGGLATFRAALVQNQHLAVLAKNLKLDAYMLYAHGSDLCHDLELRHAMANCFEALMGALFLDGGIKVPDKVFGNTKFTNPELRFVWFAYPLHPLQQQELSGDRHWIESHRHLQKLTEFEEAIGVKFNHIRLLARAFTDRSVGYTNLTQGSNQRLEFLGDTVLQLVASEYLYKYFPEHHEGHLSLLRSSLVNNRTQAVVCNDLGMTKYAVYSRPKVELKTKDRADLLEAFLGALYVDKGLKYCGLFCNVCFFPRLQDFIMNQDWNDPKSKLQQCCLTLRSMDGGEPDIPIYKVIECKGPTNTREYTVAVYFRQKRLAKACGHSIQMAEMNAARKALENSKDLFPQLDHQKRVIAKSVKKQHGPTSKSDGSNQSKSTAKDEVKL